MKTKTILLPLAIVLLLANSAYQTYEIYHLKKMLHSVSNDVDYIQRDVSDIEDKTKSIEGDIYSMKGTVDDIEDNVDYLRIWMKTD